MANPNPSPATRFRAGKEQERISKKGSKKSAEVRRKQKEVLDVFKGAREHTSQEELMEMYEQIKRFARRGSLPHWQEVLRLTGQEEHVDSELDVSWGKGMDDLAR